MEQQLPNLEKVRGRNPAPAKPDFFDAELTNIGGTNPYGESMLKVGWGWDLKIKRFGKDALKYPGPLLNRWILEKWLSPKFYGSQKHWEQHRWTTTGTGVKVDLLGEYPHRGAYGMVIPLTDPMGGYLPLGGEVLNFIRICQQDFDRSRLVNAYSDAKRYAQIQKQMALEEEREQQEQDKIADDSYEYFKAHEHELNQERSYSMPSLWTPDGERTIH